MRIAVLTIVEGGTASYTIKLRSEPHTGTGVVTVTMSKHIASGCDV